ncbi:MAG TPA: TolC family protein [Rhizomicrobium sp.]|jgi:NodT family efflux transporter outer membrane factor (OMF) lipoprotein|nr:TolC family protein [Rhizomicrobium sp.]
MKSLFRGAFFRGASASVLALGLAACTDNPQALNRPGDVPPAFTAPIDKAAPIWPKAGWWANFGAEELTPLEETAQKENLDIAQAAAQVLAAEANDGIALSALFPSLGANIGVTRSGSNTPEINSATGSFSRAHNAFNAGLTASYQQGFFGTQYFQLQASREDLRSMRYAAAVTGISVSSQVADEYFTVLSFRERIAVTNANIAAAKRILAITQAKVNSGVSSNLDLAEEEATVAQQESTLPSLIESEKESRYSLAILLGRAPEGYDVKAQNLDGLVSPAVQPGMPSQLVLRNPAVAEAEAQLYAAHADVNAARSTYFPSLSLTGDAGYGPSSALSNLFNSGNFVWSIGAGILQPIFDGGKIHAQNDLARAQEQGLIAAYRKAVFTAFQDVETALGTVKSTDDQLALIEVETKADAEAFRISELQYREGTIDIISLLQNQQNLFTAQQSLILTKLAKLDASIALYNALGGGWEQKADDAAYKNQLDWWPL